jgi:spermidine/putrescine transport system permease protein
VTKNKSSFARGIFLAIMLLFMYAPIIVLVVYSFNSSRTMANWGGFSLDWYAALFKDRDIMAALEVTVSVAVLSALCATLIGTAAAIGIHSMKRRWRNGVMYLSNIPVINPDIVTGVSLMFAFSLLAVPQGYTRLLLAHITFNIPYVILSVMPKLRQTSSSLYEAALDLGATPSVALRKVILPQIMPGVISGAILAFTLSIDDFVISFFCQQGTQNLSIYIYSLARRGINPKINALSALMFVVVLALLLTVNILGDKNSPEARKKRAQKKEARMARKSGTIVLEENGT